METEPLRGVPCPERFHGIGGNRWRQWDLRYDPPVRPPERELTVRSSLDLVTLFVDGTVMTAAQQREVRERRRSAVGPVADVVALPEPSWQPGKRQPGSR